MVVGEEPGPTAPIEAVDGMDHEFPDGPEAHRRRIDCVCEPNLIMVRGVIVKVFHQRIIEPDS